jgi:signal transduction histidine kinase
MTMADRGLPTNRRILVVDDNPSIQSDFRTILAGGDHAALDIDAAAAAMFGGPVPVAAGTAFEIEAALQGEEALQLVRTAREAGRPYAMAFVDMRMPPGWDGLTTISKLWEVDAEIQTVICTAYSDRSWEEIQASLVQRDRWLVLKKPFDKIEVLQLAYALTEKWSLARAAVHQTETLERMVAERTDQLEKAHRVSREFLANANHELLTPMNGICGSLELLADTGLGDDQRVLVDQSRDCASDLLRLLTQILEFNRAEAGLLQPEAVEFSPLALLDALVREHTAAASAKGLPLRTQVPGAAATRWCGPAALVQRALGLLVGNAIKFTSAGAVTIAWKPVDGRLEFSVRDTGPGMSAQELDWIRIPFAQVDGGMARKSSGFGLGLPLAHKLVAAAGGALTIESHQGDGTRVAVSVPASPA